MHTATSRSAPPPVGPQPVGEPGLEVGRLPAAGHQQRGAGGRAGALQVPVRDQGQPAVRTDRLPARGDGPDPVAAPAADVVEGGEHLHRAGDVQALHPVIEDDEYVSQRHGLMV
ncbi:hypothetical protein GCM10020254_19760 [Streptomyces goshikiensis]